MVLLPFGAALLAGNALFAAVSDLGTGFLAIASDIVA